MLHKKISTNMSTVICFIYLLETIYRKGRAHLSVINFQTYCATFITATLSPSASTQKNFKRKLLTVIVENVRDRKLLQYDKK